MSKFFKIPLFVIFIFYTNVQNANELLLYADDISYDEFENLIAKGNVKIISNNEIITSDLVIYNKKDKKIILPSEFQFKDKKSNYYYGTSGEFDSDLNKAEIINVKILLNDGSRIVGKKIKRFNQIDIIDKASYSPCTSRISFSNFLCPVWQLDGETILHDQEQLFLYQKHSKLKLFNIPVFYFPYLVTPSPLRKERKSGFLTPSINFNFLDTKVSQSTSLPYYFNIDVNKELTLTPLFNYGGGVDSSQRFIFDYNQLISGGEFKLDYSMDTKLENQNNEKWFKNGSLISSYKQNLNEKFNIEIKSALQTSRSYIQSVDPNNNLSYAHSLSTTVLLKGYNLANERDKLNINFTTYQATQSTEDSKTNPKILPYISYINGYKKIRNTNVNNSYQFYNIIREKNTKDHAEGQQKFSYMLNSNILKYKYKSKIKFETESYGQYFYTKNKKIDKLNYSNHYYRAFPIFGLSIETPFYIGDKNTLIKPKIKFIATSSQSNTNKISNEDSTNNNYSISNQDELNRYNGNDKLDNSKRFVYSLIANKNNFDINFVQNYEFSQNSNYNKDNGINNYLSDALASIKYSKENSSAKYNTRYNPEKNIFNRHQINLKHENSLGNYSASYVKENQETNVLATGINEIINYKINTNKLRKFHTFSLDGSYNAGKNENNEYKIGYSYFDECFGITLDFQRKDYKNDNIKASDTLNLTFSFKNLGAYKSTNLAVSEQDKQEIKWDNLSVKNDDFNKITN